MAAAAVTTEIKNESTCFDVGATDKVQIQGGGDVAQIKCVFLLLIEGVDEMAGLILVLNVVINHQIMG